MERMRMVEILRGIELRSKRPLEQWERLCFTYLETTKANRWYSYTLYDISGGKFIYFRFHSKLKARPDTMTDDLTVTSLVYRFTSLVVHLLLWGTASKRPRRFLMDERLKVPQTFPKGLSSPRLTPHLHVSLTTDIDLSYHWIEGSIPNQIRI